MKSYSYQFIAEAISNLKEQSLGQALSRSGRYIFGRDSVKATDPKIPQPGQLSSRAGSELRTLASTGRTPTKTATYDPKQNKVVIKDIEPEFDIERDVPADARGYVRGALEPLKGTTLTPPTLAKAMDTASQNIDIEKVRDLESEVRSTATDPDKLPQNSGIPAAITMGKGLEALRSKFTTARETETEPAFTQPEIDLYQKAHVTAKAAASQAIDSYLDPDFRQQTGSQLFGDIGAERKALEDAGVPQDVRKRYEAGMRSAVYDPIKDALASAAKDQKDRTKKIASDIKTIGQSGEFPYVKPKGAKTGFGVAMTKSGKGLAR